jgi:hypothetical protein
MPPSDSDPRQKNQRQPGTSLSSLLLDTAAQFEPERIKVWEIPQALGHHLFGFILLMCAIPNSLPIASIPGTSTATVYAAGDAMPVVNGG